MAEEGKVTKAKAEVETVKMTDGREVGFAGKRRVVKETLIDESKIEISDDGSVMQLMPGAVSIRMDFRSGETRTIPLPLGLLPKFAGHGGEQKFGDELASPADKPLSDEDMVLAIDDLASQIAAGKWGRERAGGGGGVSGAGIVVRAIMEVIGKPVEFVKAFLQKKLDADTELTRRALYDSFRADPRVAAVIERLEKEEKAKKKPAVDPAGLMTEMEAAN